MHLDTFLDSSQSRCDQTVSSMAAGSWEPELDFSDRAGIPCKEAIARHVNDIDIHII
jgi:hypothetical protein